MRRGSIDFCDEEKMSLLFKSTHDLATISVPKLFTRKHAAGSLIQGHTLEIAAK